MLKSEHTIILRECPLRLFRSLIRNERQIETEAHAQGKTQAQEEKAEIQVGFL